MRLITLLACTSALTCLASPALAAQPQPSVTELQAQVQSLKASEKDARDRLQALEARLQALEATSAQSAVPVDDTAQGMMRGRGLAAAQPGQQAPTAAAEAAAEPDRKTPAPTDAVEVVTRSQTNNYGSRFSLEPGLAYSHFTNARLNLSGFLALDSIFLGLISIDEVDADVLTADLTARYGLTDRLQFDVNIPYLYRRSTFRSGGAGNNASQLVERTVKTSGLGDVSFGASYQLLKETARRPDIVLSARAKAPTGKTPFGIGLDEIEDSGGNLTVPQRLSTGTGVWGAAAGLSVLKTIDPLVVFGSLTYFKNFGKKFDDLDEAEGDQPGRAELGNALQYGAGVAFALNDRSSLSMSFTQRFVRGTRIRRDDSGVWQRIVGSDANIGILSLGGGFSLTDRLALLANLSVGITDDAPDMTVGLRVPYRF